MKVSHIAIKVDDLEAAVEFYRTVLGFTEVRQGRVRDHFSHHLTDGNIDVALIKYDGDESSNEAGAAGAGPCIHHIGFAVDDLDAQVRELERRGMEIISDPGVVPAKFRVPGGTIAEFAPSAHYEVGH